MNPLRKGVKTLQFCFSAPYPRPKGRGKWIILYCC